MGIGSMVALKRWLSPIQSPPSTASSKHQHRRQHPLWRGWGASLTTFLVKEEAELWHTSTLKAYASFYGAVHSTDNTCVDTDYLKENIDWKSSRAPHNLNGPTTPMEDAPGYHATLTAGTSLQISLLMDNIDEIEDIFSGTDLVNLERDILVHIGRLGALKLFHFCLSKTLMARTVIDPNFPPTFFSKNYLKDYHGEQQSETIVRTGKNEERKLRRDRASNRGSKMSSLSTSLKKMDKVSSHIGLSGNFASPKSKRVAIANNESDMSMGVKEVANLEGIRERLEIQIGQAANCSRWAKAVGIDQKMLKQRLQYGWYCRERLIKSTHSLVVYIARNYKGTGMAFDDLLQANIHQAGKMGVLKGAQRYDKTRGYRFSTYVQYWIRKSILALIARHARGILIPASMEKIKKQVQNARRTLYSKGGRYPRDDEVAELTGLSLCNVRLAMKCMRVVGSNDRHMGDGRWTNFMEAIPDASAKTPNEITARQHLRKDILKILNGLHPRERRVLLLRYGMEDGRCKSLEEIGRLFRVSKEWIRKVEKAALIKIRRDDIQRKLKYYLY